MILTTEMRAGFGDAVFRFEAKREFVEGKADAVDGVLMRIVRSDEDYDGRRTEIEVGSFWFNKIDLLCVAEALESAAHSLVPNRKEG
tara:strand:+ start:904 stop:1164 length:261 start_codon:yes stop_codon:yes gene_type:complete